MVRSTEFRSHLSPSERSWAQRPHSKVTFTRAAGPSDAQSSSARNAQAYSIIANRSVETETIDLSSSLVDGKVIVDVNLDTAGLVGSQFKIVFDNNILTLDDIVFDTGSNSKISLCNLSKISFDFKPDFKYCDEWINISYWLNNSCLE